MGLDDWLWMMSINGPLGEMLDECTMESVERLVQVVKILCPSKWNGLMIIKEWNVIQCIWLYLSMCLRFYKINLILKINYIILLICLLFLFILFYCFSYLFIFKDRGNIYIYIYIFYLNLIKGTNGPRKVLLIPTILYTAKKSNRWNTLKKKKFFSLYPFSFSQINQS